MLPGCARQLVQPANLDFLQVNAFLGSEIDARALKSGLELGLVDFLQRNGATPLAVLGRELRVSPAGLGLLSDLLASNAVLVRAGDVVALTTEFEAGLRFRDLLECRIAFADLVWPDIHELFTPLLTDLPRFMSRSKVFELFRYDRCFEITAENLEATRAWTQFTTCLTKYEAAPALDMIGIDDVERLIDFGGNTGEFALQACRRNPSLQATVLDLPVVCELGRQHIARSAGPRLAGRIGFFPGDMRTGPLPSPADLVSFKSVLHDWPDADARQLIERAHLAVRPGGKLVIFERAPINLAGRRLPYALFPALAFVHFLRPAELYLTTLAEVGFEAIDHCAIELDMEFHLITAHRPA